jgi:hypothetical protein
MQAYIGVGVPCAVQFLDALGMPWLCDCHKCTDVAMSINKVTSARDRMAADGAADPVLCALQPAAASRQLCSSFREIAGLAGAQKAGLPELTGRGASPILTCLAVYFLIPRALRGYLQCPCKCRSNARISRPGSISCRFNNCPETMRRSKMCT